MLPKLLIVDDAEAIHSLVGVHFSNEGIDLYSAYTGKDALARAAQLMPDLILLDLDLPDMTGFDVFQQLRKNPATLGTPIIFLTASTQGSKIIHGLALGATDYIAKPFDGPTLLARVRALLGAKSPFDFLSDRLVTEAMPGVFE